MVDTSKEKTFFNKERLSRIFTCVLVALALSFTIFIVAPFDMFANNLDEFNFSFSDFAGPIIILALLCTLLVFGLLFCLPKKVYKFFLAFFLATAFLLFAQQNFLNFGMNSLPGDNLASEGPSTVLVIIDLVLWVAVYALAFTLAALKDKKGNISLIALVLALVVCVAQIVSPVFVMITNGDMFKSKFERSEQELKATTLKNYTSVKTGGNIYYFCVDRFDEEFAEDAYEDDSEVFNSLQGFTWYQDNVSYYGHTFPAVTNMLTNKEYNAEESRAEYLDKAYEGDTPLSRLNDEGYQINLYTQPYYAYAKAERLPSYVDNVLKVVKMENTSPFKLSLIMSAFSLYRGAPLLVKQLIVSNSSDANNVVKMIGEDSDGTEYYDYSYDTKQAYFDSLEGAEPSTDGKQFSFIHFSGCHDVDYDENWGKARLSDTIVVSVKNSLKIINNYIERLKENGLYKDATIIITGDHSRLIAGWKDISEPRRTALFVKPKGCDSGFTISSAQTSHKDIWATIFKSEGFTDYPEEYGTPVFEIAEGENRVRKYVWHTYAYTCDEYIYEIYGSASDFNNWKQTEHNFYDRSLIN